MSDSVYPYSQGDRLNDRNTYFYSEYRGEAFLDAWHASRSAALAALPAPVRFVPPPGVVPDSVGHHTGALLAHLLSTPVAADEPNPLTERILQRFEVSKRIYRQYDQDLKAVRESGYDELPLYLQFAALCVHCQSGPAATRFLNALLKVLDTLISAQHRLRPEQGAHLAWLIAAERAWVGRVAAGVGVEVPR
jgi:hypothetical protein